MMDHSSMDHSSMDHGGMDHNMPGMKPMCKMNMLFNWDVENVCLISSKWHIHTSTQMAFSLLAVVIFCAGYEYLKAVGRKYEDVLIPSRGGEITSDFSAELERRKKIRKSVLYAVQVFYSMIVMLLFMTYNGFVMAAVTLGAGIGYYVWGTKVPASRSLSCH